jgi:hypothetical protein
MRTINQVLRQLDSATKDILELKINNLEIYCVQAKILGLLLQLAVQHSLSNAIRQLKESNGVKRR